MSLHRRTAAGAFVVVLVAFLACAAPTGAQRLQGVRASPRPTDPRHVELTLVAAPGRVELLPGKRTDVFAYNGRVPGPTLEFREGDHVVVHFRNALPEATTVHWHGLHIPVTSDGSPLDPIPPGGAHDYAFTLLPGSAGTYWYHPHPHERTGHQVAKGLYGVLIVRAPDDPLPAATFRERTIVLADNRFGADGAIDLPDPGSAAAVIDLENGREGDVVFVNGSVRPTIAIRAGEVQRWRIVNASASRVYRLALSGHRLLQVGTDGGLFETPVEESEIVLANGERAEVLVRGTGAPGSRAILQALPYDRYIPQTRPKNWSEARDLLALQYAAAPAVPSPAIPTRLRAVPAIDTTGAITRTMVLTQHLINGKSMDHHRVDGTAKLGATEIWEVENLVGMDHPFHLHGFQFQVLSRNGAPEKDRRWKDTMNVPKHETARFVVRFDDYAGKWMFHCHILDHEDRGMMGVLEVSP